MDLSWTPPDFFIFRVIQCNSLVIQQLQNDFVIISGGMSSQASLDHRPISSSLTLRIRPPALKLCCPANILFCNFVLMRSLKGLLMDISNGGSMLVMAPGITTFSVLMDPKVLGTALDKCARNEYQTSIDFHLLRPLTLLQMVLNQSYTSVSPIKPFAWHLTTTSLGKFKFKEVFFV